MSIAELKAALHKEVDASESEEALRAAYQQLVPLELSPEQEQDLERRLARRHEATFYSLEEVKQKLQQRKAQ